VSFRPQTDHGLSQLTDEKLIAYVREASRAGDTKAAKRALAILVYGYAGIVRGRMSLRVPREAVEEAADEALVRAVGSAFDGSSRGEFRGWLNTIIERTAADFYRKRDRRPKETRLPSEHLGSEDVWGQEPASDSEAGVVELRIVVDQVMAHLSDPHQRVVELHVLDGLSAAEVCERLDGMTPDNVAQVASRFRKRLRAALDRTNESAGT
jgi:RNA polymerase sigma factor (sigma-70 family)